MPSLPVLLLLMLAALGVYFINGMFHDVSLTPMANMTLFFLAGITAAVKRVTPHDVQRVAREYLTAENRTLYSLLPDGTAPKPAVTAEKTSEHAIQKFELPNGLRLLVKAIRVPSGDQ